MRKVTPVNSTEHHRGRKKKRERIGYPLTGQSDRVSARARLVAIGVAPLVPSGVSFKLDPKGFIQIDDRYQTSVPGIYAAGDIIGPPWLAHVASWEAIQAVNGIFGAAKPKRLKTFPGCTASLRLPVSV